MARPYSGASATHMFFGLLSMAAGIAWICLLYFYENLFVTNGNEKVPLVSILPPWVVVLLCAKIFCGFWVSSCAENIWLCSDFVHTCTRDDKFGSLFVSCAVRKQSVQNGWYSDHITNDLFVLWYMGHYIASSSSSIQHRSCFSQSVIFWDAA